MAPRSSRASRPRSCSSWAGGTTPPAVSCRPRERPSPTSTTMSTAKAAAGSRRRRGARARGPKPIATEVVMPALGMAQETGRLVRWLKSEGSTVTQGEPLMEVETDKATVEIEAPASGTLAAVTASEGEDIAVGQAIAVILAPGEKEAPRPAERPLPSKEKPADVAAAPPLPSKEKAADVA